MKEANKERNTEPSSNSNTALILWTSDYFLGEKKKHILRLLKKPTNCQKNPQITNILKRKWKRLNALFLMGTQKNKPPKNCKEIIQVCIWKEFTH